MNGKPKKTPANVVATARLNARQVRSRIIVKPRRVAKVGAMCERTPGASFANSVQPRPPNNKTPKSMSAPARQDSMTSLTPQGKSVNLGRRPHMKRKSSTHDRYGGCLPPQRSQLVICQSQIHSLHHATTLPSCTSRVAEHCHHCNLFNVAPFKLVSRYRRYWQ